MRATLDHIDEIAPEIFTYWFSPAGSFFYTAGEFTELQLPHPHPDTRGERRWFTLSSSPTEDLLGITTRISPDKGSSYKEAMRALKPGTTVQMAEPMGDFVLPKGRGVPLIFIAGGLGITPVRSIVRFLHDSGEQRDIHLFRIVSKANEEIFADELHDYPLQYHLFNKAGKRLAAADVLEVLKDKSLIYLAGPERLIAAMSDDLRQNDIQDRRIITDLFPGYN
ncbi:MAG TPA: FAD-dependent oxidoreductase [Candidatus Saccharimonadales bacterium]